MMRKYYCILFIILFALPAYLFSEENLAANAGFEEDYLGNLSMWDTEAYLNNPDAVRVAVTDEVSHSGKRSLVIINLEPNDAMAIQWIKVKPDTYYKISCWVMAEGVSKREMGANISILGNIGSSTDLKNTNGKWSYVELVGKTGPEQKVLPVTVRLGFYGNLSTGRAYFDDVWITPLTQAPAGKIMDFTSALGTGVVEKKAETSEQTEQVEQAEQAEETGQAEDIVTFIIRDPFILLITGSGLVFICLLVVIIIMMWKLKKAKAESALLESGQLDSKEARRTLKRIESRLVHRKNKKLKVFVKKILSDGGYEYIEVLSKNISQNGLFTEIEDTSLLNISEEVLIEIIFKRQVYDIGKAVVLHKQEAFNKEGEHVSGGLGFMFVSNDKKHLKNIEMIIGK
jgi:hypothetical protein